MSHFNGNDLIFLTVFVRDSLNTRTCSDLVESQTILKVENIVEYYKNRTNFLGEGEFLWKVVTSWVSLHTNLH